MGTYRMLLAIMVLLSHSGIYYYGFNQGIISVVAFLIMTGYTTDIVLDKENSTCDYIKKKVLRIFPLYCFYVIVTLIIVGCFNIPHETISKITAKSVIGNLLLFPVDYSSVPGIGKLLDGSLVIPAAWTLGSQFTYYLVALLLHKLKDHKKGRIVNYVLFVISFMIFMVSSLGFIPSEHGYHLITGTLWIYMIGMYIRDSNSKVFLPSIWLFSMLLFLYAFFSNTILQQCKTLMLGIIINLPVIICLINYPSNKLDKFIGKLSYGVYLNHFTVKTVMVHYIGHEPMMFKEWMLEIMVSILVAIIGYYVIEYPINKIVKKMQNKSIGVNKAI